MPWLTAIYHLSPEQFIEMPFAELTEFRQQMPEIRHRLSLVQPVEFKS